MRIRIRPLPLIICVLALLSAVGCGSKRSSAVRPTAEKPQSASGPAVSTSRAAKEPSPETKAVAPEASRPTAAALIAQLQKTYRTLGSLKVEGFSETSVTADNKPVGKPSRESISLTYKRPNKMTSAVGTKRMTVDGKWIYVYSPTAKIYTKTAVPPGFMKGFSAVKPGIGIMGLLYGTDYTKALVSPKLLSDSKISNRDCYVVSSELKSGVAIPKGVTGTETLWIGKTDLAIYQNQVKLRIDTGSLARNVKVAKGKAAKVIETTRTDELRVFQANPKVSDSSFAFVPPPGTKLLKRPQPVDLTNKPAPDFPFTAADGSAKRLSELKGKFVLLNFWALPMCDAQLPILQSLSKSLKSDTELIAINLNPNKAAVTDYLKKKGDTFPVVFGDATIAKTAGQQYGLMAVPVTFILDKKGVVRARFLGFATEKQVEDRLNSIR